MRASEILARLRQEQEVVCKGACEFPAADFPSYMKLVGLYAGLEKAMAIVKELQKEKDDA